ncbi:flagellar biosynthetic protein FliQ [Acidocella sp.]|uniref:flagellar biosynthetic protein FliQ n=1 Tax=Acidocella sp. TaxID=50710 RepID=UPI0026105315|nr:flagellar biosynthetic protein FliQ [Acidocella sp.]
MPYYLVVFERLLNVEWRIAAWFVLASLVIGLVVSYIQGIFQIDDPILSLGPKIAVVGGAVFMFGPYVFGGLSATLADFIMHIPAAIRVSW